jgi:hypothetical protein
MQRGGSIMLRILMSVLAMCLLLVGYAWADDDFYGTDVIDPADAPDYEEADDTPAVVPAGEPVPISSDQMGMYFGTGDELRGGVPGDESSYYLMHDHGMTGDTGSGNYHNETIYYPEYTGESNPADNVYGPMWGVPEDAAGLDNYNPEYYLYDPNGEQVWTPYNGDLQHVHADSGTDTSPDTSTDQQAEGIDVGDVDW